jgi:hypothetical protein
MQEMHRQNPSTVEVELKVWKWSKVKQRPVLLLAVHEFSCNRAEKSIHSQHKQIMFNTEQTYMAVTLLPAHFKGLDTGNEMLDQIGSWYMHVWR